MKYAVWLNALSAINGPWSFTAFLVLIVLFLCLRRK
jgi:hypothetical protein